MAKIIRYYNIHNLIKVKIISAWGRALDIVDKHYSTFRVHKFDDADLEVIVGDFKPQLDNSTIVGGKYYVSKDSLYCRDSHKISSWKVWIKNLDGDTKIYFTGDPLFSYLFLFKYLLEPVVFYKMLTKGIAFIHSSCISDRKFAYIFPASGGVGKTSTALHLANEGMEFFSDEYTLLSKEGMVYSYPNCIHLHQYNLNDFPLLKKHLTFRDRFMIGLKSNLHKWSLKYVNLSHNVEVKILFPEITLGTRRPLGGVILLNKALVSSIEVKKVNYKELTQRIVPINNFEMPQFASYLAAFIAANPHVSPARYQEHFLENMAFLQNVPLYEIVIPTKYSQSSFISIKELLLKIIRKG